MSDDLVKRLRRPWVNADGEEAADRIEKLEARVKELERRERIYRSALDYYARCNRNVAVEALSATEEPRP